jgi:hypothetical protein
VLYGVKAGKINSVSPGAFFFFTRVVAPGPNFTIDVTQTSSNQSVPLFEVQQWKQINLFNADCSNSWLGTISDGGGQAKIKVSHATTGQVFIVQVKYDTDTVSNVPVPDPTTVHYNYVTKINGTAVAQEPNGLDLKKK